MKLSVTDASRRLGIGTSALKAWMLDGTCPFGNVIKGKRNNFYINSEKLELYLSGLNEVEKAKTTAKLSTDEKAVLMDALRERKSGMENVREHVTKTSVMNMLDADLRIIDSLIGKLEDGEIFKSNLI